MATMNKIWGAHWIVGNKELIRVADNHAPMAIASGPLTFADIAVVEPANCNRSAGVNFSFK